MFAIRSTLHICAVFALALAMSQSADAQTKGKGKGGQKGMVSSDRVPEYFADYDLDGDGHITRAEWLRRGNFERLDTNKNGTIELSEFRIIYGEWGRLGALSNPILPAATPQMDPSLASDRVGSAEIGQRTICGISRSPRCHDGDELGTQLGLFETGLGPSFPPHAQCVNIDEHFAMDYVDKTGRGAHGGIDMPTDFGTPILAVAAGTVLAVFEGSESARGRTIVLRHSPEETGLPFWVYTEYGHFNAMPTHRVGQRVRMGEVLGPTGSSGIGESKRRPAIHFAVYWTQSSRFTEMSAYIVPENARWMDSNALYRTQGPYDSDSMKALPDAEKSIPIPIMYLDGTTEPANTKLIWPYACRRD